MNSYRVEFFAACPSNGARIHYRLRLDTSAVVMVEDILAAVSSAHGYHEAIADGLSLQFGGRQTLTAEHHGVTIETTRTQ